MDIFAERSQWKVLLPIALIIMVSGLIAFGIRALMEQYFQAYLVCTVVGAILMPLMLPWMFPNQDNPMVEKDELAEEVASWKDKV